MNALPQWTRTYRSWVLDSSRWKHVQLREGDVVVTTAYKSGTTWMLQIAAQVIFDDLRLRDHQEFGRWIDAAFAPVAEEVAAIEAMPGRRVLKTHLPLDGLPYHPGVRYIYVGRDLRDVFVSLWNHHTHYTPEVWSRMTDIAAAAGMPMSAEPPATPQAFWREWTTRGYFDWERDGYPYWSPTAHLASWWAFRHLPNLHFVHFNDLLNDLPGEIETVAAFIGLPRSPERCREIADCVGFASMKRHAVAQGGHGAFRGGAGTFFNKGTNGRWRDMLTVSDLDLYGRMMRNAPPDAGAWLEQGAFAMREPAWSI